MVQRLNLNNNPFPTSHQTKQMEKKKKTQVVVISRLAVTLRHLHPYRVLTSDNRHQEDM
jgi:hypothetical protein